MSDENKAGDFRRTKAGVAICPFFGWQSENIEGLGRENENDVNLTFCSHPKNVDDCEGNCQYKYCPILLPNTPEEENCWLCGKQSPSMTITVECETPNGEHCDPKDAQVHYACYQDMDH